MFFRHLERLSMIEKRTLGAAHTTNLFFQIPTPSRDRDLTSQAVYQFTGDALFPQKGRKKCTHKLCICP